MNRLTMTALALREFGTAAAFSYFLKRKWPAMSSSAKPSVKYLHEMGERVISFETFQQKGQTTLSLITKSRPHCRQLGRVLREYRDFCWNTDSEALPVKVNTNYRCFHLYLPSTQCSFMNSLFD